MTQNKNPTTQNLDRLLTIFSGRRIAFWIFVALAVHVVLIGGCSLNTIRDRWIDPEGAEQRKAAALAEQQRLDKAAAAAAAPALAGLTNAAAVVRDVNAPAATNAGRTRRHPRRPRPDADRAAGHRGRHARGDAQARQRSRHLDRGHRHPLIPPGAGRLRAVPADSRTMDKRLHFSWPPILCLLMGMAAGVCARFALVLPRAYLVWCDRHPAIARVFAEEGVDLLIRFTAGVAGLSAAALAGMAFVALFVRSATTLGLFRKACLLFYATARMCGVVAVRATHLLIARELSLGGADGEPFNAYTIFLLRWRLLWPVIAVSLGVAYLYILAWRRAAIDDWLGGGGPS